ncbi:MAG TPA: hypothetical protein VGM18_00550 [Candidatus Sulfotelmatobacter sp.]|jgi:hypothetical protein
MRRIALLFLLLASLSLCAGTALANSVDMQLTSVGGNQAGGVYTYPYYISVNGAAPVAMICDTYDNEIVVGETWKANPSEDLPLGGGLFGNSPTIMNDYKATALIFKGIMNGTIDPNEGNFAIWGFFSLNARNNPYFGTSGAAGLESQYLALAAATPLSKFWGFKIFNPVPGTQSQGMRAQEFIEYTGVTPEPSSFVLFGTGLLSLAGMVQQKLRKAVAAS